MDNLYQEAKGLSKAAVSSTKGAVSNTRKSWKMLKRSTARIKALSRKRFTAGAGNKFNQQMYRYMRSAAYQSVSTGGGIINTAKNVLSYAYWSVRMAANGIGAILGALFGAIGVLIIPVIIIIAVICTISGGSKGENASVGSLTGDEATIAQYLIDKGVDRTHIAAIMGNMFQESGCHPTALNSSSGAYGICQWLGGRKTGLENLAKEKGKDMSDLSVQLDWFWEEFAESCSGWNKAKYKVFCAQSDLKQCVYLFRSQFERCGESEAADANRLAQAQRIYDALGTSNGTNGIDGNGQDLKKATRRQKDVVNAANTTKSPGQGWCAAWVTNVFQSAGIGYFGGNACDMCRAYCTSTNVRDLKVGMIIADVSHPGTGDAGRLYGHVGIYIGDNKVMLALNLDDTSGFDGHKMIVDAYQGDSSKGLEALPVPPTPPLPVGIKVFYYVDGETDPCFEEEYEMGTTYQVNPDATAAGQKDNCLDLVCWYTDPEYTQPYESQELATSLKLYGYNPCSVKYDTTTRSSVLDTSYNWSTDADLDTALDLAALYPQDEIVKYGTKLTFAGPWSAWCEDAGKTRCVSSTPGVYATAAASGSPILSATIKGNTTVYVDWPWSGYDGVMSARS